jgi:hypothetical protein
MDFNPIAKDLLYATCCDAHLTQRKSRHIDPLLKLYVYRPVMINFNKDVAQCEANGAYCTFERIELKPGVSVDELELIKIDGYHVRCASVTQIQKIVLRNQDGPRDANGNRPLVFLDPKHEHCTVNYPVPIFGAVTPHTPRIRQGMSLWQFPINVSNAVTVHKLQGRTIKHLFISSYDYRDNWMYVVLSRVTTRQGLFLRHRIQGAKMKGMSTSLLEFLDNFRTEKSPLKAPEDVYRRQFN